MATRDVETSIRVSAVQVLCAMEKAKLLSDDEEDRRMKLGWLVYDREARIRKAVSGLVKSIWQDKVEELKKQAKNVKRSKKSLVHGRGKKGKTKTITAEDPELEELDEDLVVDHEGDDEIKDQFIGLKALAAVLTDFSQQLSQIEKVIDPFGMVVDGDDTADRKAKELLASISAAASDSDKHAWVAVDALWSEISSLQDWEILVKYLSVDHTSHDIEQEVWALKEDEETFMIEALLAVLHKMEDPGKGKKVGGENCSLFVVLLFLLT
jgi:cohesin complex subunit SA-1/2